MFYLKEESLEWALKHLLRFSSFDGHPTPFEFSAIKHDWSNVKKHIIDTDLESYIPSAPILNLSQKPNKTFRVIHQLHPIDAIIYTALVFEIADIIEDYRMPAKDKIACSYRISKEIDGTLFKKGGWDDFKESTGVLAEKFKRGFVLECDITDFYNQIYIHRLKNIISEAGGAEYEAHGTVIHDFLIKLNGKTSRGIPVGPAGSIVLAETIMSDIDQRIARSTRDFTRYVDDIYIFFDSYADAIKTLHDLTEYLYKVHRLVLSSAKTKISAVDEFFEGFVDPEKEEESAFLERVTEEALGELAKKCPSVKMGYDNIEEIAVFEKAEEFRRIFEEIKKKKPYKIMADSYHKSLKKELKKDKPDYNTMKYVIRRSSQAGVRCLMPLLLQNFEKCIPIIKDYIQYIDNFLSEAIAEEYEADFDTMLKSPYVELNLVNKWVSHLFQNRIFNDSKFDIDYGLIIEKRDKLLVAYRKHDLTFIKEYKDNIDLLGPWEKRALLLASSVLSKDELRPWLALVKAKSNVLEKSVISLSLSKNEAMSKGHDSK